MDSLGDPLCLQDLVAGVGPADTTSMTLATLAPPAVAMHHHHHHHAMAGHHHLGGALNSACSAAALHHDAEQKKRGKPLKIPGISRPPPQGHVTCSRACLRINYT